MEGGGEWGGEGGGRSIYRATFTRYLHWQSIELVTGRYGHTHGSRAGKIDSKIRELGK